MRSAVKGKNCVKALNLFVTCFLAFNYLASGREGMVINMSEDKKFCYNCMHELTGSNICPKCGYFQETEQPDYCLKPGSLLNNRYIVGNMISENSEGITYIAYDNVIESRVEIREYIPRELCSRAQDSSQIVVTQGKETIYKALMSDFSELAQSIAKFRTLPNIKQVYEVFEANNTAYYVGEYIEGNLTLAKMLLRSEGLVDWSVFSGLIMPIINTVGILNASNIIHRGISPDTIFVTPKGELKLGSFCISAVRASKSELESEIIEGYAAPEQYSVNSWYGPWTDVYAVCAVMYRTLTGIVPPDARERGADERLIPPRNINPDIPAKVAAAITGGMRLSPENRVQSMKALSVSLADNRQSEIEIDDDKKKKSKKSGKKTVLIVLAVTAVILIIAGIFIVNYAFSSDSNNTESINSIELPSVYSAEQSASGESSAEAEYAMPDLVGLEYAKVIINDDYTKLVNISMETAYSDKYEKGLIIKQSIAADKPIALNTDVKVTVSLGSKNQTVPDFNGKSLSAYISELDDLGISYNVRLKDTSGEIAGTIVQVSPEQGTKVDLSKGESVTIYLDNTAVSSDTLSEDDINW